MSHDQSKHESQEPHYLKLLIMSVLSFVAMYLLMYAMIDKFQDFYLNLNQAYMAALMTAPMLILEILLMSSMYKRRGLNAAVILFGLALLVFAFLAIRWQWGVGNEQFLLSMIPHHSGAILMCREADLSDPAILELCKTIASSQQAEIDQMRGLLAR